jgi:hypothetical protein
MIDEELRFHSGRRTAPGRDGRTEAGHEVRWCNVWGCRPSMFAAIDRKSIIIMTTGEPLMFHIDDVRFL